MIEIPVDLPWDAPGSELRERLIAEYEEHDANCVYLSREERAWQDHNAGHLLYVLEGGESSRTRRDIPGLRDVIRDAFIEHSDNWALSGGGKWDHCFEGDPEYAEVQAIVALQALWKFGPRVLPNPSE